jgi:cyanophycin synthetase
MDDKVFLKNLFAENNLPVPFGGVARSLRQAKKIFEQIQAQGNGIVPVIVKPRSGSRGRHSTTYIYTLPELIAAFKIAKQLCYWVVVEEQLFGPVYRATVINYELGGVLRGDPPKVTGDGLNIISELINIFNNSPHPGVINIIPDQNLERFLLRQNIHLSSVLKSGQVVNLSEKIGVNYGGSSSEDFDICHPDNKELFVRAARLVADPIVGFDFIIPDIQKSWREQKCGFLEANSLPFINLHHEPLHGSPRNIAAKVWNMMGVFGK